MTNDIATVQMVQNVISGVTPPEKVVGRYEQLADGTYNLIFGVTEQSEED